MGLYLYSYSVDETNLHPLPFVQPHLALRAADFDVAPRFKISGPWSKYCKARCSFGLFGYYRSIYNILSVCNEETFVFQAFDFFSRVKPL